MKIERVFVTPAIAKKYLELNTGNRKVKEPVVLRYANDMKNGKWKQDTAETLKFSSNGKMLDGQQRCLAVIKSGKSFWFYVATGMDENVFDVLDTGSVRNSSDTFYIRGIKNHNTIPSIIQFHNIILNQYLSTGTQKNERHNNSELLDLYYEKEDYWQSVANKSHAWYMDFAKILSPSWIGGFYARFHSISEDEAELFIRQLCTGLSISNNVIAILRKQLMKDKLSPKRMQSISKAAIIIKAWNSFRKGETPKQLKFTTGENFPEPF